MDVSIEKGNVEQFQIQVRRGDKGLIILAKVHPDIENFVRGLGSGETYPVTRFGREWKGVGGDLAQVYDLAPTSIVGPQVFGTERYYALDQVGAEPWGDRNIALGGRTIMLNRVVNLSFLRLQGISAQGASFAFGGVYKSDEAITFAEDLKLACRAFFMNFLKPVNVVITLSTQELR